MVFLGFLGSQVLWLEQTHLTLPFAFTVHGETSPVPIRGSKPRALPAGTIYQVSAISAMDLWLSLVPAVGLIPIVSPRSLP